MSNIFAAYSGGSNHYVSTALFPAGSGLATDSAIYHFPCHAAKSQHGRHRSGCISGTVGIGTVFELHDNVYADYRANYGSSSHSPHYMPS